MFETPQTFASKTAIIEVLKRAAGELPRREVLSQASRELQVSPEVVANALAELQREAQVASIVVDGQEHLRFTPN
jgi:predicted GNAT family N-acyltransferase